jgi:hypothetical protein
MGSATCKTLLVVQALYLLSLKLTLSVHQRKMPCTRRLDIFHCIFSTEISASKHLNKIMRNCFSVLKHLCRSWAG